MPPSAAHCIRYCVWHTYCISNCVRHRCHRARRIASGTVYGIHTASGTVYAIGATERGALHALLCMHAHLHEPVRYCRKCEQIRGCRSMARTHPAR